MDAKSDWMKSHCSSTLYPGETVIADVIQPVMDVKVV
jgi:hypothetical protein